MPSKGLVLVIQTSLEHAEQLPVARRVELYRGLADICGDPHQSAHFAVMARDLESAEQRCREFAFRIKGDGDGESEALPAREGARGTRGGAYAPLFSLSPFLPFLRARAWFWLVIGAALFSAAVNVVQLVGHARARAEARQDLRELNRALFNAQTTNQALRWELKTAKDAKDANNQKEKR